MASEFRKIGTRLTLRQRRVWLATALAGLMSALLVIPAVGSRPVPRTINGCVSQGVFISSDGYRISPVEADGGDFDLRPFEGQRLTLEGMLAPGDVFTVTRPPRTTGLCPPR